jgi:hypothetical protein
MSDIGNGRNRVNQWLVTICGVIAVTVMGWSTWVTINVGDYVSGEKRGERATMTEFRLELATHDERVLTEFRKTIEILEVKMRNEQLIFRQLLDLRLQKMLDDIDRQRKDKSCLEDC